jgi:hypothetical protein
MAASATPTMCHSRGARDARHSQQPRPVIHAPSVHVCCPPPPNVVRCRVRGVFVRGRRRAGRAFTHALCMCVATIGPALLHATLNQHRAQALGHKNILCVEDLIHEILTVGPAFKEASNFLWPFKLNRCVRALCVLCVLCAAAGGPCQSRLLFGAGPYSSEKSHAMGGADVAVTPPPPVRPHLHQPTHAHTARAAASTRSACTSWRAARRATARPRSTRSSGA